MNNVIPLFKEDECPYEQREIERQRNSMEQKQLEKGLCPLREDELERIVESIDDDIKWAEEYYTQNEDNHVAEYVSSFNHGNADEDDVIDVIIRELDDEGDYSEQLIEAMKEFLENHENLFEYLEPHTELSPEHGFHQNDRAILSMQVGEMEHELSDENKEALAKLTKPEREYVKSNIKGYIQGDYAYVCSEYDRWDLEIDLESLMESIKITVSEG